MNDQHERHDDPGPAITDGMTYDTPDEKAAAVVDDRTPPPTTTEERTVGLLHPALELALAAAAAADHARADPHVWDAIRFGDYRIVVEGDPPANNTSLDIECDEATRNVFTVVTVDGGEPDRRLAFKANKETRAAIAYPCGAEGVLACYKEIAS